MKQSISSITKILAIIFWALPVLIGFIILFSNLSVFLSSLLFVFIFFILAFLINIPNLIFIILGNLILIKKFNQKKSYFYIAFLSNLFNIILFIILMSSCNTDYACYSEGYLTSGSGILVFLLLGTFFGTLPFSYICNKLIIKIIKG